MVCNGCTFTECLGMDCPELANTRAAISVAVKSLQMNKLKPMEATS